MPQNAEKPNDLDGGESGNSSASGPVEDQQLYRDLVETSQDLVWQCDADGRYTYLNPAWEQVLGYRLDEMLGRKFSDFQMSQTAQRDAAEFESLLAGRMVQAYETIHCTKSGNPVHLSFSAKAYFDRNGRVAGTRGTAHNITGYKRAEQALVESEHRFRSIIESSPMGMHMYALHPDGRLVFEGANPAADTILGVSNAQFIGKTIEEAFPPLMQTEVPARYREVAGSGRTWRTEQVDYDDNRIRGAFEVVAFRIGPDRMAAMFLDITERKRIDEALAAERERLAVTLRSIGDGVIATDTAGRVVLINQVAERMTGWVQEECAGLPLAEVFLIVNETTREARPNPVELVLKTGLVQELANHTMLVSRDGREYIIADSGAPIRDKTGAVIGVVLVFRDTTEKQKFIEAAERTQRLESLGALAGGIAHDFNNLLAGIFGYIEMARVEAQQEQVTHYLSSALGTMGRARALTQQLLTFAKGGTPVRRTAPLFPFVRETVLFALSGSAVTSRFHVARDLWQCDYDSGQIGQVFDNLVINAIQAMPSGGELVVNAENVSVSGTDHPPLCAGRYVRITVRDTGPGVPREIHSRIFDPFFTTKVKGSGLGLATCYSIVTRHGGIIEVDPAEVAGAAFVIHLPASDGVGVASETPVEIAHEGKGVVLLMDDEQAVLETVSFMLKRLGYGVTCARDGQEALAIVRSERDAGRAFVAVILDLTVPGGMGGKETIVGLRAVDTNVPVFVASGYADDPIVAEPAKFGFTGSIGKPFSQAELKRLFHRYLGENASA